MKHFGALFVMLLASASAGHAEPIKCQRAIARASATFVQTEHMVLQRCVAARRKAGDAPTGALAACKADPKVAKALAKASSVLTTAIGAACGGKDHVCGGNLTGEDLPSAIGWPSACPNFENGTCVNQIFDCRDITTCVECIDQSAVDEIVTQTYETFTDEPASTNEDKCQVVISRSLLNFFNAKSSALRRCWDAVLNGKTGFTAPCPAGDASGKTQTAINKAEELKVKAICKACGGGGDKNNDGLCDQAGFDPQTQIGFGATCPQVQVPGGADCGAIGTVDTLQKYIDCIDCVAEFKVDCLDRNAVLGAAAYPAQCNPASTMTLSSGVVVGKDLETSIGGSLGFPAPAGNLTVTITSSDPARLLLSTSGTQAGSASITLTVGAGSSTIPSFVVQALAGTGTVGITATAPGYAAGTSTITLNPSGFVMFTSDFTTTAYSADTRLDMYAALLDPATLAYVSVQAVRGGLTVDVPVTSGTLGVGTITGNPAVFNGGDWYNGSTAFHPVGPGSSPVSVGAPAGFSLPSNYQQLTATVTLPHLYLSAYWGYNPCGNPESSFTIGSGLEVGGVNICLDAAPPSPVTVTITSSDGTVATVSTDPTLAGGGSASFPGVSSGNFVGSIVLQGQGVAGTSTTLTLQAPGYADGTASISVDPAGFVTFTGDFSTTTYSADTALGVYAARLDPSTLAYAEVQAVQGGSTVNVPVTSASPGVGTITGSPAVFNGGDSYNSSTAFHPVGPGSSLVSVGVPAGFSVPNNYQQLTATVTTPHVYLSNAYYPGYCNPQSTFTIGSGLEVTANVCLDAAPPSAVSVTITSSDGTVAAVSTDPTVAGGGNASLSGVSGTFAGTVVIQAQGVAGTGTTLTVQAPGYADGTVGVTVDPAGFVLLTGDFTTTTYSPDSALGVYAARLDPSTFAYAEVQAVQGGSTVSVPVTSANPGVGTITGSPAVFNGGDSYNSSTAFHPLAVGSSVIDIGTPSGFSMPSNYQQLTATVTTPHVYLAYAYYPGYCNPQSNFTVGRGLQVPVNVCLDIAPPSPVTVTITSSDGTVTTVSTDATVAGGNSGTFSGVGSSFAGTIYVQGQGLATTTLTAHASGYSDGSAMVTVDPAGFITFTGDFTTTTYSADTAIAVEPALLDPTTLNFVAVQAVQGGSTVSVPVTSANPGVGTITGSPAVFNGGDSFNSSTAFHPLAVGSSVVGIGTPSGFSAPSNYQQLTATVRTPHVYLSNAYYPGYCNPQSNFTVGRGLQVPANVCLDVAPPSPVTVTITSSDGTVTTVSTAATVAGGNSGTFSGVSSTFAGTIYVQGQGLATTTVTAHASGYSDGSAMVTVDPAGFVTFTGDFTTTMSSADTAIDVEPALLDPITLNFVGVQAVQGGSTVSVPVTSANPGVGTITGSPVVFNGGDSSNNSAAFHPVGPGTSVVSVDVLPEFSRPSNYRSFTVTVSP